MEESKIIELYIQRNEEAIQQTDIKYGSYCFSIANHILYSFEDAREIVNDSYLHCWNTIPPFIPTSLLNYLGKLTRNLSLDQYRRNHAQKRGNGSFEIILDELGDCIGQNNQVIEEFDLHLLTTTINQFLLKQSKKKRMLFVSRYYYSNTLQEIAEDFQMSENHIAVILQRMRKELKKYLNESGYEL